MGPEGGKEALWVTPAGQALLIDTGSPGGRDTDRIMEAITAAGVTTLDFLLSTHNHVDRVGGLQELVKRIPVAHFYDHGATIEDGLDGHQKACTADPRARYKRVRIVACEPRMPRAVGGERSARGRAKNAGIAEGPRARRPEAGVWSFYICDLWLPTSGGGSSQEARRSGVVFLKKNLLIS